MVVDVVILAFGLLLEFVTDNMDPEKKHNAEKVSEISGVRIFTCNWNNNKVFFSTLFKCQLIFLLKKISFIIRVTLLYFRIFK